MDEIDGYGPLRKSGSEKIDKKVNKSSFPNHKESESDIINFLTDEKKVDGFLTKYVVRAFGKYIAFGFKQESERRKEIYLSKKYLRELNTKKECFRSSFESKITSRQIEWIEHYSKLAYNHFIELANVVPDGQAAYLCAVYEKTGYWMDLFSSGYYGLKSVIPGIDLRTLPCWEKSYNPVEYNSKILRSQYICDILGKRREYDVSNYGTAVLSILQKRARGFSVRIG
jgi:hypothetical protein